MKLILSKAFVRDAKRLLKRNLRLSESVRETLNLLELDISHPQLKTHKLKGKLKDCWACSAGYDLRIIFEIVKDGIEDAILLQSIGTHDEVY